MSSPAKTRSCGRCGAAASDLRFCGYCGAELPCTPVVLSEALSPRARDQFRSLREHPEFEQRMRLAPGEKWTKSESGSGALFLVLGAAGIAVAALTRQLAFLALPGALFLFWAVQSSEGRAERIRRFPARVRDKHSRTNNEGGLPIEELFVTLERENGTTHRHRVDGSLWKRLSRRELGIATLAGPKLIEFDRMDA